MFYITGSILKGICVWIDTYILKDMILVYKTVQNVKLT